MSSRGISERRIGRRRNGKEQACEPCRKGKLACDHTVPVCSRCVRRKITAKCVYHPAPMTRSQETEASTILSTTRHALKPPTCSLNQLSSPQQRIDSNVQPPHQRPNHLPSGSDFSREKETITAIDNGTTQSLVASSPLYDWDSDAAFRRSARYYGPTSFSAVFTEGVELSADLNIYEDARKHPAKWYASLFSSERVFCSFSLSLSNLNSCRPFCQPLLGRERPSAPTVRMNQVVKALFNIPSREICEKLLGTFASIHNYLMNPVLLRHCRY
jgi:hypothetical protein